jgi:general secretion pathway protein I
MAVLAVVLLAVYRLQAQSLSITRNSRFQAVAPLLARQKIAEVELAGLEKPLEKTGVFKAPHSGYGWRLSVADTRSPQLGETAARLKKIDLTISRDADGLEYQVRAYRFFDR